MSEVQFIAEIGISHNGSLDTALKIIDMCESVGIKLVKFQKRDIDTCYTKEFLDSYRESPWGFSQREQKKALELNREEYDIIDTYCKKKGLIWFSSAWDIKSLVFLKKYDLPYNKVASPLLTNIPLIEAIAKERKKTFISTGMSAFDDIDKVVDIFRKNECPFVLMHCVGIYPCPDDKLNLNMITTLRNRYKCEIGYSCHSPGILPSIIAAMFGAVAIEKHVTLDRTNYGSDQAASLEKRGIELIIKNIGCLKNMIGDGTKIMLEEESKNLKKLRYW